MEGFLILVIFSENFCIFEHTEYLYLDFYKGAATLYYKYWNEKLGEEMLLEYDNYDLLADTGRKHDGFAGWTTTEIIQKIFDLTIYSDKPTRRTQQ